MPDEPQIKAMGIPWYKREHYPRLLEIFEDADKLPRTFDEWLLKAEQIEKRISQSGVRVLRAEIDPNTFPQWCASKGLKLDAHGRTKFATHKCYETFAKGQ